MLMTVVVVTMKMTETEIPNISYTIKTILMVIIRMVSNDKEQGNDQNYYNQHSTNSNKTLKHTEDLNT